MVLTHREACVPPQADAPYWEVLTSLSGVVSLFQDPVLAMEWMTLPVVWLGVRLSGLKLCHLALEHRMHLQGQVKCKSPGFSEWFAQQEALASSSGCCTGAKEIRALRKDQIAFLVLQWGFLNTQEFGNPFNYLKSCHINLHVMAGFFFSFVLILGILIEQEMLMFLSLAVKKMSHACVL